MPLQKLKTKMMEVSKLKQSLIEYQYNIKFSHSINESWFNKICNSINFWVIFNGFYNLKKNNLKTLNLLNISNIFDQNNFIFRKTFSYAIKQL